MTAGIQSRQVNEPAQSETNASKSSKKSRRLSLFESAALNAGGVSVSDDMELLGDLGRAGF